MSSSIGQRIKEVRKYFKLNQKDFGRPIGVSYGHISNIESDKDNASDNLIRLLAIEYRINEDWLKNGEGDMLNQTFTQDNLSLNESCQEMVDEIASVLQASPVSRRALQLNILYSALSFIRENKALDNAKYSVYLEIIGDIFRYVNNFNNMLQVSTQRGLSNLDLKKLDENRESTFAEIADSVYGLEDLYYND